MQAGNRTHILTTPELESDALRSMALSMATIDNTFSLSYLLFKLKTLIPSEKVRHLNMNHGGRRSCKDRAVEAMESTRTSIHMTLQLFKTPLKWTTPALLLIVWMLSFG